MFNQVSQFIASHNSITIVFGLLVLWLVFAKLLRPVFSIFNVPIVAEIFHKLFRPISFVLLSILGLQIANLIPATSMNGAGSLVGFGLKLVFDFGLAISIYIAFSNFIPLLEEEYADRKFSAYGSYSKKNVSTLFFHLLRPLTGLAIFGFFLWLIGVNVQGFLVTFGSLGVAIGFAMQHVLANIMAGISLALDTPFSKNDLIRIGDNPQIYQVLKRGLRITTVKNISTHETVFLPNKELTEEQLVDVTRPTDDLRSVIDIGVPYSVDLREVRAILTDIANGHPHVIGALSAKEKSIKDKVLRLYLRGVFPDCKAHFVELARLQSEDELNKSVESLILRLESWADFIDQVEEGGFDKEEKVWLDAISDELPEYVQSVVDKTTEWQILFRNCTASFKPSGAALPKKDPSTGQLVGGWKPEGVDTVLETLKLGPDENSGETVDLSNALDEEAKLSKESFNANNRLKALSNDLSKLRTEIGGILERGIQISDSSKVFKAEFWPLKLDQKRLEELDKTAQTAELCKRSRESGYSAPVASFETADWQLWDEKTDLPIIYNSLHLAFDAANKLSELHDVAPLNQLNKDGYNSAEKEVNGIQESYSALGDIYIRLLRDVAKHITKTERISRPFVRNAQAKDYESFFSSSGQGESGYSIVLCRNRGEDLFLSNRAGEHILNHPICAALSGLITDDDERRDVFNTFQVWGDKSYQLMEKMKDVQKELSVAKSMTIDTKMRDLAVWLKEEFKDPAPSWKYPLSPVEGFDDSSIHMTMKFYVDNVRMERYLRPFNTYTQIRLRIVERLSNAGIIIPFPQRDIHIKTETNDVGE